MPFTSFICPLCDFPKHRKAWNRLAQRHRHPMLTHEWHTAALRALEPEDTPTIVMVQGKDGHLRGIAPLVRRHGHQHMTLLANDAVPEPATVIVDDQLSLAGLFEAIRSLHLPLRLSRMPEEVLTPDDLARSLPSRCLHVSRAEGGSPWLPISGEWLDFERSLSSQRRSDLRRAKRRAEALGRVSFEITRSEAEMAHHHLTRFIGIERKSWKLAAGTTIAHDARATRFFEALCSVFPRILFGFLRIGDTPIAGVIALEYGGSVWVLKTAYDDEYRACSPGILLMHEVIRHAFENGSTAFEFLGFEEPWIELWTKRSRRYNTSALYTFSPRGASALWGDLWKMVCRRLRRTEAIPT